jgi:hypothetical protein
MDRVEVVSPPEPSGLSGPPVVLPLIGVPLFLPPSLFAVPLLMATTATIDYERLEECIHFAAIRLRPGRRPKLLEKASLILSDFELMQKALRVEVHKIRSLKKPISKAKLPARASHQQIQRRSAMPSCGRTGVASIVPEGPVTRGTASAPAGFFVSLASDNSLTIACSGCRATAYKAA